MSDKTLAEAFEPTFVYHGGGNIGTFDPVESDKNLAEMASAYIEALHERINALERRLQETHDIAIQALAMAANPIA